MNYKIKACLIDIDQCIDEINDFVSEKDKFDNYRKDLKTKKAVERNLKLLEKQFLEF